MQLIVQAEVHRRSSAVDSFLNAELVEMPKVNLCHQQHKGNFLFPEQSSFASECRAIIEKQCLGERRQSLSQCCLFFFVFTAHDGKR